VERLALVAGTANPPLAAAVAAEIGVAPVTCAVERFPDGELAVRLEESVRGAEVFVLQPTAPPVNDHLVELLALADACRRAAAGRVTAVVPYFGYGRGDKRDGRRAPVMARLAADLLQGAGVEHVMVVDPHAAQIEGFFRVPVDTLGAAGVLCDALRDALPDDAVVVSPDLGGARRAADYGARLGRAVAICRKRRLAGDAVEVLQVIGDVRDRPCVIVDDMITTGGTVAECAAALARAGARPGVVVAATHGVLAPGAERRLADAGVRELVLTDTVAPHGAARAPEAARVPRRTVSVAPLIAEAIRRHVADRSLRDLG
jgi:ribose-phosphate pyrophosphokinase